MGSALNSWVRWVMGRGHSRGSGSWSWVMGWRHGHRSWVMVVGRGHGSGSFSWVMDHWSEYREHRESVTINPFFL